MSAVKRRKASSEVNLRVSSSISFSIKSRFCLMMAPEFLPIEPIAGDRANVFEVFGLEARHSQQLAAQWLAGILQPDQRVELNSAATFAHAGPTGEKLAARASRETAAKSAGPALPFSSFALAESRRTIFEVLAAFRTAEAAAGPLPKPPLPATNASFMSCGKTWNFPFGSRNRL